MDHPGLLTGNASSEWSVTERLLLEASRAGEAIRREESCLGWVDCMNEAFGRTIPVSAESWGGLSEKEAPDLRIPTLATIAVLALHGQLRY